MDERGGGLVQLWAGFFVFLAMLLFAVQVLFNLYAASVVTAVSYDAARRVAGSDGGPSHMADAEEQAFEARYRERRDPSQTVAELGNDWKRANSHRAKAAAALREAMSERDRSGV